MASQKMKRLGRVLQSQGFRSTKGRRRGLRAANKAVNRRQRQHRKGVRLT